MRFVLVDRVLEQDDNHLVALRALSAGEEYLRDHFEGFPVMPGVLMVEAMTQACRRLLVGRDPAYASWVLGEARGVRFNALVRPGDTLRLSVVVRSIEGDRAEFQASADVLVPGEQARSATGGRLTLRPARVGGSATAR